MNNPSPKKTTFPGMDWFDLVLAVLFIGLLAGIGAMLLSPYGWIPGAVLGAFLIYLAWRQRSKRTPPKTPPSDDLRPEI